MTENIDAKSTDASPSPTKDQRSNTPESPSQTTDSSTVMTSARSLHSSETPAAVAAETEQKRELLFLEKLNICGQLVLVLIGLVAALIYGFQLHAMNEQLEQMKESGQQTNQLLALYSQQLDQAKQQASDTHDLAAHARTQAEASSRLADSALAQTDLSRRSLERQNSGSVSYKGIFIDSGDDFFRLRPLFQNVGQGSAVDFSIAWLIILDGKQIADGSRSAVVTISPGTTFNLDGSLKEDQVKLLRTGKSLDVYLNWDYRSGSTWTHSCLKATYLPELNHFADRGPICKP